MILYVVRHGDPDYELDSLTPLGKLQAEALVKRFTVHGLDRVYTSPLGRAKETAAPTCRASFAHNTVHRCSKTTRKAARRDAALTPRRP